MVRAALLLPSVLAAVTIVLPPPAQAADAPPRSNELVLSMRESQRLVSFATKMHACLRR